MKKYKFIILSCCVVLELFSGCSFSNDSGLVDVTVTGNIEPHSDETSVSGNIENNNNKNNVSDVSGDVNINQGTINDVKQTQNINVYVDKVLTDLVDINGNVVEPFADNAEIYVPLSSLSEIIDKPVEYDRTNKAVYVGESPNRTTNMLDIVHGYDPQYITEYSFTQNKGTEYFTMAGKDYTDGMVAYSGSSRTASVNFNLEGNYNTLSFRFGHLDGTEMHPTKLTIKLDGYVEREIEINAEDYPINVELNLTNAMQLRFEIEIEHGAGYALTNMTLA